MWNGESFLFKRKKIEFGSEWKMMSDDIFLWINQWKNALQWLQCIVLQLRKFTKRDIVADTDTHTESLHNILRDS